MHKESKSYDLQLFCTQKINFLKLLIINHCLTFKLKLMTLFHTFNKIRIFSISKQ
jgi:hypothetical protein